jgi:hypothetical protein
MTNTVLIKRSSTANSIPSAGNLQPGEIAINYADGNLFYKNSGNVVTLLTSNQFVSVAGNITGGNILTAGIISATGNITGGNINTVGVVSATGNVSAGNLYSNATANVRNLVVIGQVDFITTASPINIGSGQTTSNTIIGGTAQTGFIQLGRSTATQGVYIANGAVSSGNTKTISIGENGVANSITNINIGTATGNGNVTFSANTLVAIANTSGTALSVAGNITTGNYYIGNGSQLTGIVASGGASITNGTSNVTVAGSSNVTVGVTGTTVATFASTGLILPGIMSATGNITGGNLNAVGLSLSGNIVSALVSAANITTTANISGSFFIGNGSQLTGISGGGGASIANGTSNVNINTSGGNIAFSVGGTANVITLDSAGFNFADTTIQDTGMNLGRVTTTAQWWNLP